MAKRIMVMGGLNPIYMKRLALYLSGRLGDRYRIVISDDEVYTPSENDEDKRGDSLLCFGSEEFVRNQGIVICESKREDDDHIYMYQSADRIQVRIMDTFDKRFGSLAIDQSSPTEWILFSSDTSETELMAHSVAYAASLEEEVLYISLGGRNAIKKILELDQLETLSDFIIDIRNGLTRLESRYLLTEENVTFMSVADNPGTVSEVKSRDIDRIIELADDAGRFSKVIVVIDAVREETKNLLEKCNSCIHLTYEDSMEVLAAREWEEYLKNRYPDMEVKMVKVNKLGADHIGRTLISEWKYKKKWKYGTI